MKTAEEVESYIYERRNRLANRALLDGYVFSKIDELENVLDFMLERK